MKGVLIGLILLIFATYVSAFNIQYTLPTHHMKMTWDDSTHTWNPYCEEDFNSILTDLRYTRIYMYPYSGGSWTAIRDKDVTGREGQVDTLNLPDNAHFYLTAINSFNKESCASPIIDSPYPTGVPDTVATHGPKIEKIEFFDVQGRKIEKPVASGIYFKRIIYNTGLVVVFRTVILK